MPTATKEIVMLQNCPGCAMEGNETPLRNQLGVFGTYCLDDKNNRRHIYNDTEQLREEIAHMKKSARKAVAPKVRAPEPAAVAVAEPEEPSIPEKPSDEPKAPSAIETPLLQLTEMDCYRLSELLGQPVPSAGDLVGAVYALRTEISTLRGESERRTLAASTVSGTMARVDIGEATIPQRADGGLTLQIYIPEPQAKLMTERAVFNNQPMGLYAQGVIEYQMVGSYFPVDVPSYPAPANYDGVWVAINVPECYLATMVDRAMSLNMGASEYLQNYVFHLIQLELFP